MELEQQTATSEVLRVISRSPTDVQPVFDMIAESAARLCKAQFCFVYRFDRQLLHFVAHHGLTAEVLEINRRAYPAPPSRRSAAARAVLEGSVVQIPDLNADPDYVLGAMAVAGIYRSVAAVPTVREVLPIGSIAITRGQAGLLPDRQINRPNFEPLGKLNSVRVAATIGAQVIAVRTYGRRNHHGRCNYHGRRNHVWRPVANAVAIGTVKA